MIGTIDQVPAGGALQIVMQPRTGSTSIRLTRALTSEELVDQNSGTLVYEGRYPAVLDAAGIVDGTTYWYRPWYRVGSAWYGAVARSATPVATFAEADVDPMGLLRTRLMLGFAELVDRTSARSDRRGPKLSPASGVVPVLLGTPVYDNVSFPLVTLHTTDDGSEGMRAIGEVVALDEAGLQSEGWLSSVQITITGWSTNYDERHELRRAIKDIVIANLAVFDAGGLTKVSLRLSDRDDVESYPAPMYAVDGTFTCLAPSVVSEDRPVIADVIVNVNVINGGL